MSKKTYYVEIPVTMKLMVMGVEADSEEDAIEKVMSSDITIDIKEENNSFDDIEYEWDMHHKIVQGNVFYGTINETYVEEEDY